MKPKANFFVKLALAAFLLFAVVMMMLRQQRVSDLREETQARELELEDLREEVAELQYELDLPIDDEYVLRVARRTHGLYPSDAVVFNNDISNAGTEP